MKEIEQYIKPAIIAFIPTEIFARIFWIAFTRYENAWVGIIAAVLTTYEIFLIVKVARGIVEYVKRRDEETQILKENQEYMIHLLRAQRFEEEK